MKKLEPILGELMNANEVAAHLELILDHEDNDLSPNDRTALKRAIEAFSNPPKLPVVEFDPDWTVVKQAELDELKRFREREPWVQRLLGDIEEVGFASNEQMESYSRVRDFGSCISSAADTTGAAAETAGHSLEGNAQTRETTEE